MRKSNFEEPSAGSLNKLKGIYIPPQFVTITTGGGKHWLRVLEV